MSTSGSSRSSHPGSHQLRSPSSFIVAGTSTIRTTVASSSTAVANPTPNILTIGSSPSTKAPNTLIMMRAAEVMTRAVAEMPSTTAASLSPRWRYSSRTRDSRKTS
jgi:hypothetical protein